MDNVKIKSLGNTQFEMIHGSWVRAFGDYQVKIDLPIEALRNFFRQNSVALEASIGAFLGDELVGFWINGMRTIAGRKTAYDSGTALWPEYRGKGLSKLLAAKSNKALRGLGVQEYILEVLSKNEKAYNLYLKDGFKVSRNFLCFKTDKPLFGEIKLSSGIGFEEGPFNPEIAASFPSTECPPSWQNEITAMANIKNLIHAVVAKDGNVIVGFGLIEPGRGRISQIGVKPHLWDSAISSEILRRLCKAVGTSKDIAIINTDKRATQTQNLLKKHGFALFIEQYEMKKEL